KNGPGSFAGRKLGILATEGADAELFNALVAAVTKEKGACEIVCPKIDGVPSVLFDAVAILASNEGAKLLAGDSTAKDFINDAFAHCKFIGYSPEAALLFEKVGLAKDLDEACIALASKADVGAFVKACRALRYWKREPAVDLDATT